MSILLAITLFYLLFCLGNSVLRLFKIAPSADEEFLFSAMLGLGLLSYLTLGIGLLAVLNTWTLVAVLGILFLIYIRNWKVVWNLWIRASHNWKIQINFASLFLFGFLALVLLCLLAGASAPETANDSLCYHLHLPKVFLMQGRVGRMPYEINSLFPFFMEMLYTLGLGLKSVMLAKFFHLLTGVLACLGIVSFSRRFVSPFAAWAAAIFFLTTPGIVNQLPSTYVDVGYASYTFFTLLAFLKWRETGSQGWLLLSGILMGFVLGIKYLGAISFFALCLGILFFSESKKKSTLFSSLILFAGASAIAGGYWYFRSWIEWGNPVYPYFAWLFKHGDPTITYDDIGVTKNVWNFITIPWTLTMAPYRFEGYGNNLGPAYLAWIPGLWLLQKRFQGLGFLSFYSFFYLFCWFVLGQSLRFLFPILPVLAVLMALSIEGAYQHLPKWLIQGLIGLTLASHAGLALYHYRGDLRHFVGLESTDNYLRRTERTYQAAEYINTHLPKNARILAHEIRLFYINRPAVREDLYAQDSSYFSKAADATGILTLLKKDGFTHILYETDARYIYSGPALRIPGILKDPQNALALSLEPLYTYNFKDAQSKNVFQYTLYEIPNE